MRSYRCFMHVYCILIGQS